MQSLSANSRTGLAPTRPFGQAKRSIMSKNIKPPHAKGSRDNFGVDITSVSLALLMSLSASPAFADSDSYEEMLKNFRAKSDAVKQYENAAKTSSNLIASPTPPVSDEFKLPFRSFFGSENADKTPDSSAAESPKPSVPVPSFSAPKVDMPKFDTPKMPEMPSFTAPKMPSFSTPSMPSFSAPKFEMPKMPDMPKMPEMPSMPDVPKMEAPKFEAPSVPSPPAPAVPAVPKPIAPPVVKASEPSVVVKPYVPPPPPPPAPVTPAPAAAAPAAPAAPATSSQGDFLDRWQRDQVKSGSATKAITSTPQKKDAVKKEAPIKVATRSGKRQGPLPLWLAEFVMLGLLAGLGAAVVLFQDTLKGVYVSADKAIAGATANFNKKQE